MSAAVVILPNDNTIAIGDAVGDMHLHTPTSGICKGWTLTNQIPVEITEDAFYDLYYKIIPAGKAGMLLMNKYAYVVSKIIGADRLVAGLMVIYRYDHRFFTGVLVPG